MWADAHVFFQLRSSPAWWAGAARWHHAESRSSRMLRSSPAQVGRCCLQIRVCLGDESAVAILTGPGGPVLRCVTSVDAGEVLATS